MNNPHTDRRLSSRYDELRSLGLSDWSSRSTAAQELARSSPVITTRDALAVLDNALKARSNPLSHLSF